MSQEGKEGFDLDWTYQTRHYSRDLIIEKECRYFFDAFITSYLGRNLFYREYKKEFHLLADRALQFSVNGFMHRDFQSRNIMVTDHKFYLIDFQGGRIGPIQYDLASLLIDPYVQLSVSVQDRLVEYGTGALTKYIDIDRQYFRRGYRYCAVTRNLQALGAFGYLSRVKGKAWFEQYIPAAVRSLRRNLSATGKGEFPKLIKLAETIDTT